MKLEITGGHDGQVSSSKRYTVKLDGHEIGPKHLIDLRLEIPISGIPVVIITVRPTLIEVDAEVAAAIGLVGEW